VPVSISIAKSEGLKAHKLTTEPMKRFTGQGVELAILYRGRLGEDGIP
jgi:hypothetical protein